MSAKINLPTPMTSKARQVIQGIYLDSRLFAYGPNDWGTAAWYKEKYPGFTDYQYTIFEMYSNGMTPKQPQPAQKALSQKQRADDIFSR